jgi:hypothetical protein
VVVTAEDGGAVRSADLARSSVALEDLPQQSQLLLLGAFCARLRRAHAAVPALSENQVGLLAAAGARARPAAPRRARSCLKRAQA